MIGEEAGMDGRWSSEDQAFHAGGRFGGGLSLLILLLLDASHLSDCNSDREGRPGGCSTEVNLLRVDAILCCYTGVFRCEEIESCPCLVGLRGKDILGRVVVEGIQHGDARTCGVCLGERRAEMRTEGLISVKGPQVKATGVQADVEWQRALAGVLRTIETS
jgi:hypothetical protein